jgi:WD40 repeat protein
VSWTFHWDVATGKELACLTLSLYAFSRDGKTVAVATGNAVRLYDVASGKELPQGAGPNGPAYLIGLASDGRTLVTADKSKSIVVWDTATGEQRLRLEGHEKAVTGLLLSADGRTIVSSDDESLRVWDVATGRQLQIRKFAAAPGQVQPLACSPDGKLIVINNDWNLQLVATTTGRRIWDAPFERRGAVHAAFLPDGRSLVVCAGGQAHVCEVTTGKDTRQIEIAGGAGPDYGRLALSLDGRLIAFLQKGQIAVSELADGAEVCRSEKLAQDVHSLALSPDGRTVAWGSNADPLVHLLDVATGKERHAFEGHSGGIVSLTFSADGKTLVSGGTDTTLLVWDLTAHQAAPGSGQPAKPISPTKTPTTERREPTTTAKGTQRG